MFLILIALHIWSSVNLFASELTCSKSGTAVVYVNGYEDIDLNEARISAHILGSHLIANKSAIDKKDLSIQLSFVERFSAVDTPFKKFVDELVIEIRRLYVANSISSQNVNFEDFANSFLQGTSSNPPKIGLPNNVINTIVIEIAKFLAGENKDRIFGQVDLDVKNLLLALRTELDNDIKVLVVTHGEGGLYYKQARRDLFNFLVEGDSFFPLKIGAGKFSEINGLSRFISASHIGTLLDSMEGKQVYRNYQNDLYLLEVHQNSYGFNLLPANIPLSFFVSSDPLQHDFSSVYLADGIRGELDGRFDTTLGGIREAAELLESNCGEVSFFFRVDPKGTYLFTDRASGHPWGPDNANSATRLNFNTIPGITLKEGDIISLQCVGASIWYPGSGDVLNYGLLGVFVGAEGFLFPGPGTTAPPLVTIPTVPRNFPTDIPQDRYIPNEGPVNFEIPFGATGMSFSVHDGYFRDNSDPNGDFGVEVKLTVIRNDLID